MTRRQRLAVGVASVAALAVAVPLLRPAPASHHDVEPCSTTIDSYTDEVVCR